MMNAEARKRLGQYFSGSHVANLLINLCVPAKSDLVIDPMAGTGDMLVAAIHSGVQAENTSGIEIDPYPGSKCRENITPGNVYIGDAFSPEPYLSLGRMAWDLVITNPPYVRYQSMGAFESDGIRLKSAKDTRQSLSKLVNMMSHLNDDEKGCFQKIIRHYSGLSDLAVPAWLLCAALTRAGGRIAMVVPEAWISRDYALSIKYMLLKFFNIEYIVEDLNSAWFSDALIKTNLLVARRVGFRESLSEIGDSAYKHIRLGASLIGENSLVERLAINGSKDYGALKCLLTSDDDVLGEGFESRNVHLSSFLSEMAASHAFEKLLGKLEPRSKSVIQVSVPRGLQEIIGEDVPSAKLADIGAWGFQVGQGLRTGANKFFYTELLKSEGLFDFLVTDRTFGERIIPVAQKYSLPAFRYQSDAQGEMAISKSTLSHRLLYIQEDFYTASGQLQDDGDASLANYIAIAEKTPIESNGQIRLITELSAVKPNKRTLATPGGIIHRHWFMLPALTNRHTPQLCISRVNHKNARCHLIADEGIVVDANFSTLWMAKECRRQVYAMFALLNSTWTQGYLEAIATVMGGGALKVEASHIRKMLLPLPADELVASLSPLGERLADETHSESIHVRFEIDNIVLQALLGIPDVQELCVALRHYLHEKVDTRQR